MTRNTSTDAAREYWKFIDNVAKNVAARPKWQGGDAEEPRNRSAETNRVPAPNQSRTR